MLYGRVRPARSSIRQISSPALPGKPTRLRVVRHGTPPPAAVHRSRAEPDFGTRRQGDNGKISMSEDELRQLVRTQIDKFMAQQSDANQQDALRSKAEMRTNAVRDSGSDPE